MNKEIIAVAVLSLIAIFLLGYVVGSIFFEDTPVKESYQSEWCNNDFATANSTVLMAKCKK